MPIVATNITLDPAEGMDKITSTEKVTTPYFSDGTTELLGSSVITSSTLSADNQKYFFGISNTAATTIEEFNVAFGSTSGFGHNVETSTKSESEAIYKQFASMLLTPTEVTGGFFISRNNSLTTAPTEASVASGKDVNIFILTSRRTNHKDRLNKGNWTIALSGSSTTIAEAAGKFVEFTDDSVNNTPVSTPMGDRYNIVSGALGTIAKAASVKTFGFYYPDAGVLVFSQQELSSSIPGNDDPVSEKVQFGTASCAGFAVPETTDADTTQALRFINCLTGSDAKLSFRDEEDQISAQYFCRIRSGHCNFSNNPTFVSGSLNELRHSKMRGNPQTFITKIQLYNNSGDMVAVGNLSTPLKKNFSSEATIKVKLTY
jgi:hypothetical protein